MKHVAFAGIVLVVALSACGDDAPSGPGGAAGDVAVRNDFFSPDDFTATVGTGVTWVWNSGGREHNVTFEDGSGSSATKGSGTHERTFPTAGTFRYRCTIHSTTFTSGMVGSVVVQ